MWRSRVHFALFILMWSSRPTARTGPKRANQLFQSSEGGASSALQIASDGKRFVAVGGSPLQPGYAHNGYVYVSDPLVGIGINNTPQPQINLSGVTGRS